MTYHRKVPENKKKTMKHHQSKIIPLSIAAAFLLAGEIAWALYALNHLKDSKTKPSDEDMWFDYSHHERK